MYSIAVGRWPRGQKVKVTRLWKLSRSHGCLAVVRGTACHTTAEVSSYVWLCLVVGINNDLSSVYIRSSQLSSSMTIRQHSSTWCHCVCVCRMTAMVSSCVCVFSCRRRQWPVYIRSFSQSSSMTTRWRCSTTLTWSAREVSRRSARSCRASSRSFRLHNNCTSIFNSDTGSRTIPLQSTTSTQPQHR